MGSKTYKSDFRVVVRPRSPGDFGIASIGGIKRSEEETISLCEEIARDILRHCDNLPTRGNRGVDIEWDDEKVCEHCGDKWTEEGDEYNGGCCAKDAEAGEET